MNIRSSLIALLSFFIHSQSIAQTDSNSIELNIFPNPNRGDFYITLIDHEACRSQLFSMDGKLVKTIYLQDGLNYISIDAPEGMYILKVGEEEQSIYKIALKGQ